MPRSRTGAGWMLVLWALVATGCENRSSSEPPQPTIGAAPATSAPAANLRLPNRTGSVRFAVIGDAGRGDLPQHEVSVQMQAYRRVFPFDFVIMLGDNVYDGGTPLDYELKFERPYKPLLDAGVTFHAAFGNHDDPNQLTYPAFNMGGHRYYTFTPKAPIARALGTDVRFFVLDTEQLDRAQLDWVERELEKSDAEWKIPYFHRTVYSAGRYARPAQTFRLVLEPIFLRHGVSVAFSGHEHFYERTKPQRGITYFVSGGAGSLRIGDIRPSPITEVGFDRDYHFMLVEIAGQELHFQAISRAGVTIDAGVIHRPAARLTPP